MSPIVGSLRSSAWGAPRSRGLCSRLAKCVHPEILRCCNCPRSGMFSGWGEESRRHTRRIVLAADFCAGQPDGGADVGAVICSFVPAGQGEIGMAITSSGMSIVASGLAAINSSTVMPNCSAMLAMESPVCTR